MAALHPRRSWPSLRRPCRRLQRFLPPDTEAASGSWRRSTLLFAAFEAGDAAGNAAPRLSGGPGDRDRQPRQRQRSPPAIAGLSSQRRLKPGEGFQERISDPAIEIDGDVAMVWAPFVVRVGGKVSNCGYDHFDLVRDNGAWKIMNLTFSSRTTGCPAQ